MDIAPDIATTLQVWLNQLGAVPPRPTFSELRIVAAPSAADITIPALAALAAEALARERTLWIVTANDTLLPDISNAIDLRLRPLCLIQPGADLAGRIALRATLSLLKSRLARASADSEGPAWQAMRAHLQAEDALWRAALAWCARGLNSEPPPARIGTLFPVRIGPHQVAERLATPAEWVVLVQTELLPPTLRQAWPGARCTLLLEGMAPAFAGTLAQSDETIRLRAEIEVLAQELAEMELELATVQGELAAFSQRYHSLIAPRIATLDRLHAELAEQRSRKFPDDERLRDEAAEAAFRAERSRHEHERRHANKETEDVPFVPSNDLKKRFRQLAQKIHPDRAHDEVDRAWRTQLMSEANRAYRAGDLAALDEIYALWLEGPQDKASPGSLVGRGCDARAASFSSSVALKLEVERMRRRIAQISSELDRLYGSKLYELFTAARFAARQGRDLLCELADRLDAQIAHAEEELERITA